MKNSILIASGIILTFLAGTFAQYKLDELRINNLEHTIDGCRLHIRNLERTIQLRDSLLDCYYMMYEND